MKTPVCLALVLIALLGIASTLCADSTVPTVTIVSPEQGVTLASDAVEITADYSSPDGAAITGLALVIDGEVVKKLFLNPPQAEGTVSFTWEAARYDDKLHDITVRVVDEKGRVGKTDISVLLQRDQFPPGSRIRITAPKSYETVAGLISVEMEAERPTLVKYVIFLVDDVFKAMSNVRPFTYLWDTNRYLNGMHSLQVKAYLTDNIEIISPRIQVRVNNPGGATTMRTQPSTPVSPASPEPPKLPARTTEPLLPEPMHSESPTSDRPAVAVTDPEVGPPGAAPFVSLAGDLIKPPAPLAPASESAQPSPIQIAALPSAVVEGISTPETSGTLIAAPSAPVAQEVAEPVSSPSIGMLPTAITSDTPPLAESAPGAAPIQIASLPTSESIEIAAPVNSAVEAELANAPALEPEPVSEAAQPAPMQLAVLPPSESQRETLPEAPVLVNVETKPSDPVLIESPTSPATPAAPVARQIAMLPPRPVERTVPSKVTAQPPLQEVTYMVQSGDCLWSIASQYQISPTRLAQVNELADPSLIKPGQRLRIPVVALYLDDVPLASDVPPSFVDNRAIVPLRVVVEGAGGKAAWDAAKRQVHAQALGHEIVVTIGSDKAKVDGAQMKMDLPARLQANRTVVPMRFLGDALDLALQYEDGIIHIASAR